jgi:hypothetical protein
MKNTKINFFTMFDYFTLVPKLELGNQQISSEASRIRNFDCMNRNITTWLVAILIFSMFYPVKVWSAESTPTKTNTTLLETSLATCKKVDGKKLAVNTTCTTIINAAESENIIGLTIDAGEEYMITVPKIQSRMQTWHDASQNIKLPCGVKGSFGMNLFFLLKKVRESLWFSLIAEIKGENKPYDLCLDKNITATKKGELILYANDAIGFYRNNSGEVLVEVYRHK